jgi:hypothetical protein
MNFTTTRDTLDCVIVSMLEHAICPHASCNYCFDNGEAALGYNSDVFAEDVKNGFYFAELGKEIVYQVIEPNDEFRRFCAEFMLMCYGKPWQAIKYKDLISISNIASRNNGELKFFTITFLGPIGSHDIYISD